MPARVGSLLRAALVLAVLALCSCATQGPGGNGDGSLLGTGNVNGYVYVPATTSGSVRQGGGLLVTAVPLTADELEERGLEPASGALVTTDGLQACVTTRDGAYALKGVGAGERVLSFEQGDVRLGERQITVAGGRTTSGELDPEQGAPPGQLGAIIGYVLTDRGPVDEIGLTYYSSSPSYDPNLRPAEGVTVRAGAYSAVSDAHGFFLIRRVPPGSYFVTDAFHEGSVEVEVLTGATAICEEPLPGGNEDLGSVAGRVVRLASASGEQRLALAPERLPAEVAARQSPTPVAGALVAADSGHLVLSGSDGRFVMNGVPPGQRLMAAAVGITTVEELALSQVYVERQTTRQVGYFPQGLIARIEIAGMRTATDLADADVLSLFAVAYDGSGRAIPDVYAFDWATTAPEICYVDFFGYVRALQPGTVRVTASLGGITSPPVTLTIKPADEVDRRPGKVVFVSSLDLVTVTGDGLDRATVMLGQEKGFSAIGPPALSPDGRRVAFEARKPGQSNYDLYLYDMGSGLLTTLTNTPTVDEADPSWGLDGAALVDGNGLLYSANGDLYVWRAVPGGAPTRLTNTPNVAEDAPVLHPDGERVTYMRVEGGIGSATQLHRTPKPVRALQDLQSRIAVFDPAAPTRVEYISPEGSSHAYPRWAPDGSQLVCEDLDTGAILSMAAPGTGDFTELAGPDSADIWFFQVTFAPDSAHIAYTEYNDRTGRSQIMAAKRDGTEIEVLSPSGLPDYYPSWAGTPVVAASGLRFVEVGQ